MHRQIFLLLKQFQIQRIEPPVDVPVDVPQIIALDIVAVVGEFDAAAFPLTLALPLGPPELHAFGRDGKALQTAHEIGVQKGF